MERGEYELSRLREMGIEETSELTDKNEWKGLVRSLKPMGCEAAAVR
jgi:hypothetical protein